MPEEFLRQSSSRIVRVGHDRDRLLVSWTVRGQRYRLYLRLPDTKENRRLAEAKATQIEWDIKSGNFDPTLEKYQPQAKKPLLAKKTEALSVLKLFEEFTEHKSKLVDRRTLEKYAALETRLSQFFKSALAGDVTEAAARKFIDFLAKYQKPLTIRDRLPILKACWQWGVESGRITSNPWVKIQVKAAPRQQAKPFTRSEITAIIEVFRSSEYRRYAPYVEFLFLTGCRTAEAIGLRWRHISDDYSSIWIGESITRGIQKSTKTNRDRIFPCNEKLNGFLRELKPKDATPDDLVFPAASGKPIDDNNFRDRAWRSVLKMAGVKYRKPYNTRHTFISHCLAAGMSPVEVASIVGNDVQVLYRSYAGVVSSRPKVPDIF